MSRTDDPMSCFRCYDMKVVDPVVMQSIRDVLVNIYTNPDGLESDPDTLEMINRHIILLDALPED